MTSSHQDATSCQWFSCLASPLDRRSAVRLVWLFIGAILARGRRTVTSWIRAAGLSRQYQPCYTTVAAAGKRADNIAGRLIHEVVKPLVDVRRGSPWHENADQRMGPTCRGLASSHNPTPVARLARRMSTATSGWCSGSWRSILHGESSLCRCWPVCTCGPRICRASTQSIGRSFRTKLEMGVESLRWAWFWLRFLGKPLWVVVDGAYAKAPFLKPAMLLGMTVVSRLRKDAALWTIPGPRVPGRRGRPRVYGETRIDLAKRAGQRRGWTTSIFDLYGKRAKKRYKTFVAMWRPVGGAIRVVLVEEPSGWSGLLLHRRVSDRSRDSLDGRRPVLIRDRVPRLQGDRRSRPAAGAVRVGKHRCIPHLPLDVHDDRSLGMGSGGGRLGGPPSIAMGRSEPSPKPRRQASGLARVNCWPRRFARFYAPGSPRRKFGPSPSGCLPWRHESEVNRGKYRTSVTTIYFGITLTAYLHWKSLSSRRSSATSPFSGRGSATITTA